jgi:hypothetical protein
MISDEILQIVVWAWSLAFAGFGLVGIVWLKRYWQSAIRRELFRKYVYPVASLENSELLRLSFRQLIATLSSSNGQIETFEPMSRLLAKYAIDKKEMIRIVVQESRSLNRTEILDGESRLNTFSPSMQSDETVGRLMLALRIDPYMTVVPFLRPFVFRALAKASRLYLQEIQTIIVSSLRAHRGSSVLLLGSIRPLQKRDRQGDARGLQRVG